MAEKQALSTAGNAQRNLETTTLKQRMKMLTNEELNKMLEPEVMSTFVVNLDDQDSIPAPEGGELLITMFDNKICRVAWRPQAWTSWGPPVEGEKRA